MCFCFPKDKYSLRWNLRVCSEMKSPRFSSNQNINSPSYVLARVSADTTLRSHFGNPIPAFEVYLLSLLPSLLPHYKWETNNVKSRERQQPQSFRKTGVPPVAITVADPITAFIQIIPDSDSSTQIALKNAIHRIVKHVSVHRPQEGPLKKIKLQPKKILMDRLTLWKDDDGKII
jgi:hypothetical protein